MDATTEPRNGKLSTDDEDQQPPTTVEQQYSSHGSRRGRSHRRYTSKLGISFWWPYPTIFPAQQGIIDATMQTLWQGKKGALIESPTGTGKSMAIIVAVLAYIAHIKRVFGDDQQLKVVFVCRVHTQLKQLVKSYKRTFYASQSKMAILGSRKTLCVNEAVQSRPSSIDEEWYVYTK